VRARSVFELALTLSQTEAAQPHDCFSGLLCSTDILSWMGQKKRLKGRGVQVASTTMGPVLWAKSSFLDVFAPAASHKSHPFDPQQDSQPSDLHSGGQRSQDIDLSTD
jgi:hypothetical protein